MVSLPRQLPEPTRKHMADTTPGDPVAKQERQNHPVGTSAAVPTPHVIVSDDEEDNKPLFANFGKTFKKVASAVARTAASAAEMLKDEEMRKRGANVIAERARFLQQEVRNTINRAPKSIQGVLSGVQQRIADARLRARLEASKDAKVDVQVGLELFEAIPQEWRSRLWMALLQHPACADGFGEIVEGQRLTVRSRLLAAQQRNAEHELQYAASMLMDDPSDTIHHDIASAGDTTTTPFTTTTPSADTTESTPITADANPSDTTAAWETASRHSSTSGRTDGHGGVGRAVPHAMVRVSMAVLPAMEEGGPPMVSVTVHEVPRLPVAPHKQLLSDMPRRVGRKSNATAAMAAAAAVAGGAGTAAGVASPVKTHIPTSSSDGGGGGQQHGQQQERQSTVEGVAHETHGGDVKGDGGAQEDAENTTTHDAATQEDSTVPSLSAVAAAKSGGSRVESGDLGEWEVVAGEAAVGDSHGRWLLLHAGRQKVVWDEAVELKQEALVDDVDSTEWPAAPDEDAEHHYHTLLSSHTPADDAEDLDDVIGRDIHRTFPEHPQFGFHQGQQELFRVLKAYALLDAEVGYCQGMAFLVGVLLMYLPEEPAFRTATLLLMPPGPNLRRLYQPTMEGLKLELRKFEWLMQKFLPELLVHLEAHNIVSVLYAAQWFLTIFSCPFPPSFACRVIDIMLLERSDAIMQRAAMAVMAECASDLMQLDDFEDIITYLKTQLAGWKGKRARRVLNNAFMSPITMDVIVAAEQAVQDGFSGSFSRMQSRIHSVAEEGGGASGEGAPHMTGARGSTGSESATAVGGTPAAPRGLGVEESEDEYLRMVMEIDGLWGGGAARPAESAGGEDMGSVEGEDPHHLQASSPPR